MNNLKIVTVRIASVGDSGVRAWSDDVPTRTLTCANHDVLFGELTSHIAGILKNQGFDNKLVREIHQYTFELQPIDQH